MRIRFSSEPDGRSPALGLREEPTGYVEGMTSVLAYLFAVLFVPVAVALLLFVMARVEGEPSSDPKA
jgi:hypothetical protein